MDTIVKVVRRSEPKGGGYPKVERWRYVANRVGLPQRRRNVSRA